MPRLDAQRSERLLPIKGTPPSLINVPPGCPFHPRCGYEDLTDGKAATEVPPLREVEPGHLVACHLTAQRQRELWAQRATLATSATEAPSVETPSVETLTGEEA
jgi:peptide/nickel transport system ATP-binding protein